MYVLVTGALGILGNSILNDLSKKGKRILIYDKLKNISRFRKISKDNMKFIAGDLTDYKKIKKILIKYKIESVFHLGAQTQVLKALENPEETFAINLFSTVKFLELIRTINRNILFIYSSSDKAYGELLAGNSYLENYPLNSIYPYDVSKSTSDIIAQSYAKTYGLKVGIIRSANIFGPHDRNLKRIIPETIISLLKKKKIVIRSNGKLKRDYIYVDDVANAYLMTYEKLKKSNKKLLIYNVGSKYNLSVIQIVKHIAEALKIKKNYYTIKNNSKKEIKNQRLNFKKIKYELKWKQKTSLKEGLIKTIKWYKENLSEFK